MTQIYETKQYHHPSSVDTVEQTKNYDRTAKTLKLPSSL